MTSLKLRAPQGNGQKIAVKVVQCPTTSSSSLSGTNANKNYQSTPHFMSSCISDIHKEGRERRSLEEEDDAPPVLSIREELAGAMESVKEFVVTKMNLKEKKVYREERIEALGGRGQKNQKMPYHILTGLRRKAATREAKEKDMNRQAQIVRGQGQLAKRKKPFGRLHQGLDHEKNRQKEEHQVLRTTQGHFRQGVLHISKQDRGGAQNGKGGGGAPAGGRYSNKKRRKEQS